MCEDCARESAAREEAEAEAEENRRTAEAAVKFLGRIAEATWNAGLPGGDREQTLKNVNALVSALAAEREAHEETRRTLRNAIRELVYVVMHEAVGGPDLVHTSEGDACIALAEKLLGPMATWPDEPSAQSAFLAGGKP